jgi:hypothetical protein
MSFAVKVAHYLDSESQYRIIENLVTFALRKASPTIRFVSIYQRITNNTGELSSSNGTDQVVYH